MFRSPRSESHLTVQMAEELKAAGKCQEALDLLRPVIRTYREGGWTLMLRAVLSLALKCAFLVASITDYVEIGLELAGGGGDDRVAANLSKVMAGKVPSAEPGLTTKADRAAVGAATEKWASLEGSNVSQVNLNSTTPCLIMVAKVFYMLIITYMYWLP